VTGKTFAAGVATAAGVGIVGAFLAFRPAAKVEPPCSPWPACNAVATVVPPTSIPTLVPISTPTTIAPSGTPTVTSGSCSAVVVGSFSAPGGKFPTGYADSLAIAGGRLLVREAYGYSVHRLDGERLLTVDLEGRPGYTRTGDGQQTVVAIGASEDGTHIVAGWKTSEHGTLWLSGSGANVGEWPPPRALGGVGVVTVGTRYVGLALAGDGLYAAPLVGTGRLARTAIGPSGGVERSLVTSGRLAAYVTISGALVMVTDGASVQVAQLGASAVALEGDRVLIGVRNGYRLVGDAVMPLPETPAVIALLRHSYAALSDGLYCDGTRVLSLTWSPRVMRGSGSLLYVGDGTSMRLVRVS